MVWFNQMVELPAAVRSAPTSLLEEETTTRALEVMGRLSTSEAADPAITTSQEDSNRLAFQTGSPHS